MWKWTDENNIKVVIVDEDSLEQQYIDFDYSQYIPGIKKYKARKVYDDYSEDEETILYFDVVSLLKEITEKENCESYSIIVLSSNHLFIKEMIQNHIGTIYVGEMKKDWLKSTPDFICKSITKLKRILNGEIIGYGAEVILSMYTKKKYLISSFDTIDFENDNKKKVSLYFGGRYYSDTHRFILDDPLTKYLRLFKNRNYNLIDQFYDTALDHLNKIESIDIVTFVPLKPKDIIEGKFDRFNNLHLEKCNSQGIYLEPLFECVKDFTQKSADYNTRYENVKDAFVLLNNKNVQDKTIVVLDDLYSTGATIHEISTVLYNKGAKRVIALLLAVNQTIESTSVHFQRIACPVCGQYLEFIPKNDGTLFFGCPNYKEHLNQKTSMSLKQGLHIIKLNNALDITETNDLEDEY